MLFYLGTKVEEVIVDEKTRKLRNKAKSWKYGYDETLDVIIISKDGTLGEIYYSNGIKIGFPEKPEHKEILNWDKTPGNQKWKREPLPEGLNETTQFQKKYEGYINSEFKRREEGIWIYLNGHAVYLTGLYYMFVQWMEQEEGFPNLRIIQSELMIYWEACVADHRCYGINYVKNRRFGWSALCLAEMLNSGTVVENKKIGLISKTGDDAQELFDRLVYTFKTMPFFFMPIWDGTSTPKKELSFSEPTKKRKAGELLKTKETDDGLNTKIKWHATVLNKMDGGKVYRSAIDECGKFPKDVPFTRYWSIVKTSHRLGRRIVGKSMTGSTVNAMKDGGAEFKKIYDSSNPLERTENKQTKSGLYRIFIPAKYCQEGFFDVFGFSIVDDPEKPILTDLGDKTDIGAARFLKNELDALKDDPESYNEQLRQFPDTDRDAFRDEATDCSFNLMKLTEQIDYNENDLPPGAIERGNFTWKDGIQDTEVVWNPNTEGRFWIRKDCHPPMEFRNKREKKLINGVLAFAPLAGHLGCGGIDPYNRSKNADGRGSLGACHITTKTNTSFLPNDACILEYIDRPRTIELFFEDMIMAHVYFSMPFLCELSNERFLALVKERGYRHFSMNNPFKLYKDLSDTEKEFGGAPPQDTKIGDQQFYAVEQYIEEKVGVARDNSDRPIGEMGEMYFTRTLSQLKDVDPSNRTKYDAYISFSLSRIGCQKRTLPPPPPKPKQEPIFETFDNSNVYSKRL